uniref:Uncharacterized protein n=1 Tax=Setaria viridis TaxID=4556 RepID=A0A4U6V2X5_SETVI|nr:hypothetical protein SEVIR_4G292900v2 [Setaria viridis]
MTCKIYIQHQFDSFHTLVSHFVFFEIYIQHQFGSFQTLVTHFV